MTNELHLYYSYDFATAKQLAEAALVMP